MKEDPVAKPKNLMNTTAFQTYRRLTNLKQSSIKEIILQQFSSSYRINSRSGMICLTGSLIASSAAAKVLVSILREFCSWLHSFNSPAVTTHRDSINIQFTKTRKFVKTQQHLSQPTDKMQTNQIKNAR